MEDGRRKTEDRGQKTDSGWIGIFDIDYLLAMGWDPALADLRLRYSV